MTYEELENVTEGISQSALFQIQPRVVLIEMFLLTRIEWLFATALGFYGTPLIYSEVSRLGLVLAPENKSSFNRGSPMAHAGNVLDSATAKVVGRLGGLATAAAKRKQWALDLGVDDPSSVTWKQWMTWAKIHQPKTYDDEMAKMIKMGRVGGAAKERIKSQKRAIDLGLDDGHLVSWKEWLEWSKVNQPQKYMDTVAKVSVELLSPTTAADIQAALNSSRTKWARDKLPGGGGHGHTVSYRRQYPPISKANSEVKGRLHQHPGHRGNARGHHVPVHVSPVPHHVQPSPSIPIPASTALRDGFFNLGTTRHRRLGPSGPSQNYSRSLHRQIGTGDKLDRTP